jgi:hypothetical protein
MEIIARRKLDEQKVGSTDSLLPQLRLPNNPQPESDTGNQKYFEEQIRNIWKQLGNDIIRKLAMEDMEAWIPLLFKEAKHVEERVEELRLFKETL